MSIYTLKIEPVPMPNGRMSGADFSKLCSNNPHLRLERDADGTILVDMPNHSHTGKKNASLVIDVGIWNRQTGLGEVYDSSAGFTLFNTAIRAADVAWISNERWSALPDADKEGFSNICPDFIIELKSDTDRVEDVKKKIRENWMAGGCKLAWLIDTDTETVYIFREGGNEDIVQGFNTALSGEKVLPGFELELTRLKS